MNNGFILTDIAGLTLTPEDCEIIQHPAIFGILLFAKNYESPRQLKSLITAIRRENPAIIIAVDQEGGRVQRFIEGFTALKPMSYWGECYDRDPNTAFQGLRQQTIKMVTELQNCGVQVSLIPVLDVNYHISNIIGERSFHRKPAIISQLAKCVIDVMKQYKMPTIGKHFPGHGAVAVDSHLGLPVDNRSWEEIWQHDMCPYRNLIASTSLDSVMPAHIVYPAIDDTMPAGFSRQWISNILRHQLHYQGVVITDDLTMEGAAKIGDYVERANFALEAGCDILTVCNHRDGLIQILDDNVGKNNLKAFSTASTVSAERIQKYMQILT